MNQRGFMSLTPLLYGAIAAGAVIIALAGALYVQTTRLELEQKRRAALAEAFQEYRRKVSELGIQARKDAAHQAAADLKNKERTDAENTTLRAARAALARELRDARRSRGSYLPPAAPGAASPETATVDRSEFDRTMELLDERGSRIAEEGDKAIVDLDSAKRWAN